MRAEVKARVIAMVGLNEGRECEFVVLVVLVAGVVVCTRDWNDRNGGVEDRQYGQE